MRGLLWLLVLPLHDGWGAKGSGGNGICSLFEECPIAPGHDVPLCLQIKSGKGMQTLRLGACRWRLHLMMLVGV